MKSVLLAAACVLTMLALPAHAHGPEKAQHGGIVSTASDLTFELVPQADRTALYVADHGKPMDAKGFAGKLTVLAGAEKSEAELRPVAGNRLEAALKVASGAKAVATLTTPDRKTVTVRFTVR